jgi:hypothetical protein
MTDVPAGNNDALTDGDLDPDTGDPAGDADLGSARDLYDESARAPHGAGPAAAGENDDQS